MKATAAAAVGGAAIGGPVILARPADSAVERKAANERITMGFIGPGKQGFGHVRRFLRSGDVQVVAVCDADQSRREFAKKQTEEAYAKERTSGAFKGCEAYRDFRELLARKDIDAVLIATPDHWHALPVILAAQAGKDIYCEKPLTLTINEARRMIEAVRKYKVIFQTGSQQRSDEEFHRACSLVRNGRIGTITKVNVGIGGPSKPCDLPTQPTPEGLDWDLWLGQTPVRGYHEVLCPKGIPTKPPKGQDVPFYENFPNWRNYREFSGGGMTDWGAHHFDIAQWGLGMDDSGPVEILPPNRDKREPLTYKYANGVVMCHGDADGVKFTGAEGVIEVNRGKFKSTPESLAKEPLDKLPIQLYLSRDHGGNWLECIRSRKDPICTIEIGARSVTVCHLGNLAWWNNRPLKWDPAKWEFVGDSEANTWLDRPKRDPWKLPAI
jgi:predicted dehydrogenase